MEAKTAPRWSTILNSVVAHPLSQQQLDDSQDEASSSLTYPDGYSTLWELTDKIIEFYDTQPASSPDKTCTILSPFRQTLSKPGAMALMTDIKTIGKDLSKLRSFSRYLINTILKPMKLASTARAASPSSTTDRDRQQDLKQECLQRDGFRCACSHFIDLTSAEERLVVPAPGMTVSFTHLCYILPFALGQLASPAGREAVDNIWSALYRYFPELDGKIGPNSLDQYQNLITFDLTVQKAYNSHDLAFKPLPGQPNKYEIDNMSGWSLTPLRDNQDVMSLVSSDDDIPLPEPEFFMVHRRVAKVLKVSGIRARIEAEIKASSLDPEELNPDGSTDVGSILRQKMLLDVYTLYI